MSYLIGSDEAGYGPNLGPLTVTGSLWRNESDQACLYDALEEVIKPAPDRKSDQRLVVADSKVVYKSSGSIKNLETTVLSFLLAADSCRSEVQIGPEIEVDVTPQRVEQLVGLACPASDWHLLSALPSVRFRRH